MDRFSVVNNKVSVVIPTYRRPSLLLKCVNALFQQDFPHQNFEIIVVSDGYDDQTYKALIEFEENLFPAVRLYALSKKSGPAAARNFGWKQAKNNLVVFTDDDCIPEPTWISAFVDSYLKNGSPIAAFAGKTIVPISLRPTDYERNISRLEKAEFITANCACTKGALKKVEGFDERFTMAWREDSDLHFKFIQHNVPIIKVENAVVIHPVRKAPWGVSMREEKKGAFNALLYKKYPLLYKQKIQPHPPWRYYIIVCLLLLMITGFIAGQGSLAAAAFLGWWICTWWFIMKRLSKTSRSRIHISEMIVTSAVIPIISLYWRFYGCWKYKTWLFP